MPRPKMFSSPLDEELPRVRVSTGMYKLVQWTSDNYRISVSDLVRACIAHTLGLPHENSELVARMLKDAASSLEAPEIREGEDGEEG